MPPRISIPSELPLPGRRWNQGVGLGVVLATGEVVRLLPRVQLHRPWPRSTVALVLFTRGFDLWL
jgi:hypothetical protein